MLSLDDIVESGSSVRDVLKEKHPAAQPIHAEVIIDSAEAQPEVHPVFFERITGKTIRNAALRLSGSAGPSGLDAAGLRRLCVSFHAASNDLCQSIAALTRRLCTDLVDPASMEAFVTCRLIPLNKNPGVRPISVCECLRRLVGKTTLLAVGQYVREVTGALQLCAGQSAGIEAAIHTMRDIFMDDECEGILLVDARNAFNNLN